MKTTLKRAAIPARFNGRAIELTAEGEDILLFDRESHTTIARWPAKCVATRDILSTSPSAQKTLGKPQASGDWIELTCPPDSHRVEILRLDLNRASWHPLLPDFESRISYRKGLLWLGAALLSVVAITFAVPYVVSRLPFSMERKLFQHLSLAADADLCTARKDTPSGEALKKLVDRIFPLSAADHDYKIDFDVVQKSEVNAYAMPGGRIFINSGLLKSARSGDEVAGIVAHEITHVIKRHVLKSAADEILILLVLPKLGRLADLTHLKFNRDQESDADQGAIERLKIANVSAQGLRNFFQRLASETSGANDYLEFLSDHPALEARIKNIQPEMSNAKLKPVLSDAEFASLKKICHE